MKKNTMRTRLMTIANKLVGKGYNRSKAMLKAWALVKAERLSVRVAGVTFNRRQETLAALDGKPAVVKLVHESENAHDRNAVSVWVFAEGTRGYYRIGYLPKLVAALIAPLLDKGEDLKPKNMIVTGSRSQGYNLGARISLAV